MKNWIASVAITAHMPPRNTYTDVTPSQSRSDWPTDIPSTVVGHERQRPDRSGGHAHVAHNDEDERHDAVAGPEVAAEQFGYGDHPPSPTAGG